MIGGLILATTRLIPIHTNKGKTIAQTITDRTDYAENPDKTRQGELVTGYACDPRTVDTEFLMTKKEYANNTGRDQGIRDVLAYHMRQSFKPGEVDPETANKLGYELALRFTKGRHSFIVATHEDKAHIHNHIIFNSVDIDAGRKFVNFWGSSFAVRKLNDLICIENGLSVIKNPKSNRGQLDQGHYGKWLGDKKEPTEREKLEQFIDEILSKNPSDFEEFIKLLEAAKCKIKRGKHISLCMENQKRFFRLRSLSDDYSEDAIRERISGKRVVEIKLPPQPQKLGLLIDVQNCIKAQNNPGYEQWAKIFSLKQAAKTLMFLQDNDITEIEKLSTVAQRAKDDFNDLQTRIHAIDSRLKEISVLQKHIGTYSKTKAIFAEYKKSKYSKKFLAENESAINACKAAKAYFNEQKLEKLPTIKMLQQEYATLLAEKKKAYSGYNTARSFMQEILTAKQNVEMLLNYRDTEQSKGVNRDDR